MKPSTVESELGINADDEKSLEQSDLKGGSDGDSDAAAAGDYLDEDLLPDFTPPLRIHATKKLGANERLTGSHSQLQGLPSREVLQQHMKRRKSDPNNLSSQRSGSESPQSSRGSRGGQHHKSNTFDGGSSISSLEDAGIDIDILTDKMGVLELDLKTQQEISHSLNKSLSNLPAVAERMCDDTLEDCHAFSDVKRETGTLSRGGSITTGGEVSSNVLEPLSEIDEIDDEDEDEAVEKIKITNLAEILEVPDEDEAGETMAANATVPST
jgi:hypothetical protein